MMNGDGAEMAYYNKETDTFQKDRPGAHKTMFKSNSVLTLNPIPRTKTKTN